MPRKREFEHRYLARIDNTPIENGKGKKGPGFWDRITAYAEKQNISANDALNEVIEAGLEKLKL